MLYICQAEDLRERLTRQKILVDVVGFYWQYQMILQYVIVSDCVWKIYSNER